MRLVLINPNTSAATTEAMVAIAQAVVPADVAIFGMTAPWGVPLITNPEALAVAAEAVIAMSDQIHDVDGVIVSAFGDPGLEALRARLSVPVTGIAEAGMVEAASGRRRFAVVTTTPDLADAIAAKAASGGHSNFAGTWVTPGEPASLMADPEQLENALYLASVAAIAEGAAEAIVIGGGPLATAARSLVSRLPVPIIEPVPAATLLACERAFEETLR